MTYISLFLFWSFILYCIHRAAHVVPGIRHLHWDHHEQIINETHWGWHWSNIFLFNDTWKSTGDLWITEVIPTILFCYIFDCYWLGALYYVWAAFLQEAIEHNKNFDIYPFLTSGKWHLVHHQDGGVNFGLFISLWDFLFCTYRRHDKLPKVVQSQPRNTTRF